MVKKRGYRIELGEIESALYRHDGVDRAAVVASADESGVSIAAFVALKPDQKRSIIAMKRHCTVYLPHYMVPDTITFVSSLPATSTDKVDYQRLRGHGRDSDKGHEREAAAPQGLPLEVRRSTSFSCPCSGPWARAGATRSCAGWARPRRWLRPGRKSAADAVRLIEVRDALDLDGPIERLWPELAANTARFLARDYTLDGRSDATALRSL